MNEKNTILIIDDENIDLEMLANILRTDYTIYTAANGFDAVKIAKEKTPDLILLDILMPKMDGYETLAELKKTKETCKIPVIFMSGLNNDEDEAKGLSLDVVDYITKPLNVKIIKLRISHQMMILNQFRTIERLSMLDQLTNLPNRRSFDERLRVEWKQAIREKTPISLLIMDIDLFKTLNDTYGHQQGDVALQKLANIFSSALRRPGDFAARWGGEEFTILLPDTSLKGALEIAEKIRFDVANEEIPYAKGVIKVTISIGVNSIMPLLGCSLDTFISGADKALYAAKKAGRNKVNHC